MTIAEVSRAYGLTADTLRYYERVGLLPHVHRNQSGIRIIRSRIADGWNSSNACAAQGSR